MEPLGSGTLPEMSVRSPRLLTPLAVGMICAYGFLLMFPVLIAVLLVSVRHLDWQTLLIPFATFAVVTLLLPFGFGNTYVARLTRSISASGPQAVIAQISFTPRLRSGLRAWIEDADDIGRLSVAESGIVFRGDSVDLFVPYSRLDNVRLESIGWRGLFLYLRVRVSVTGLAKVTSLAFAERGSWFLLSSRETTRRLYAHIVDRTSVVRSEGAL